MEKLIKQQFIAGAVCPACDVVDRIVIELVVASDAREELQRRRCVECGFMDIDGSAQSSGSRGIPKGRAERRQRVPVPSSVVRILDNP